MIHWVRTGKMSLRTAAKLVDSVVRKIKICTAYAEWKHSQTVTFQNEIVDFDGAKVAKLLLKRPAAAEGGVRKRPAAAARAATPNRLKRPASEAVVLKRPATTASCGATRLCKRPAGSQTTSLRKRPARKKSPPRAEHAGRYLSFKSRFSNKWCIKVLAGLRTVGSAPLPPERILEVLRPVREALGENTISGLDGGQGLTAAAISAKSVSLPGVKHGAGVFTPLCCLKKSQLPPAVVLLLRGEASKDKPCVRETKTLFKLVAGDNAAENINEKIASTLRRLNLKGRLRSGSQAQVNALHAARVLRKPSFLDVLDAIGVYTQDLRKGTLGIAPKDAFSIGKLTWLPPTEDSGGD